MSKKRKLIKSLTKNDFIWKTYRGTGKGGQKKNKTSNAVMCKHEASGAIGKCEDFREQSRNKKEAFKRMADSAEFKTWMNLEIDNYLGKVKYEEIDEKGNWTEKPLKSWLKD